MKSLTTNDCYEVDEAIFIAKSTQRKALHLQVAICDHLAKKRRDVLNTLQSRACCHCRPFVKRDIVGAYKAPVISQGSWPHRKHTASVQQSALSSKVTAVLELWPSGHSSPKHQHGGCAGSVRLVHGNLRMKLYQTLHSERAMEIPGH